MNKADIQNERVEYARKFFDYTETPIKEWLASYINRDVLEVFPDYNDESDVIGFMIGDKHYNAYVVPMSSDTELLVDKKLFEHEKVRKACSILFDAVREVFLAVTGSIEDPSLEYLKGFMPVFVEDKMAFHLMRVNRKAMQLQAAYDQRKQLEKFLQTMTQIDLPEEQKTMIQDNLNKINKIFEENTKESLDKEEQDCKSTNLIVTKFDWLHIVLEESDPTNQELDQECMKRLPTFGLQFQDPDEENYIDKLKKEHDIHD